MEKLIILALIAAGSAFHAWWKKRQEQSGEAGAGSDPAPFGHPPEPHRPEPRPASRAASWEEEIKRLLEGNVGGSVPPPLPPPIVVQEAPRPAPVAMPRPQSAREPEEIAPMPVPPIFTHPGQTEETEAHELHTREHMAPVSAAAALPMATEVYSRASRLQEAVAAHMGHVDQLTASPRSAVAGITRHDRNTSPEVDAVVAMLRNPRSARQVFIANALIGAPKALEG